MMPTILSLGIHLYFIGTLSYGEIKKLTVK